jgi:hypothetical protein
VWLRHRVYDPSTRAFLTPDPLPGTPGLPVAANPYHYANNDPIGFVDPLGLQGQPLSIDQYNDIRAQETGMQWGNIALVGLTAASFFIPGGPLIAMGVGAAIGMAPGVIEGVTTGNWDVGGIIKGGVVGGIAGRLGFAAGGRTTSLLGAFGRGGATGAAQGATGEVYDVLPLPGSDGQFDLETVAVHAVVGAGTLGAAHGLRGRPPVGDGPVSFRPPPGATADEIAQVQRYVAGCERARVNGDLSPTGRVPTAGDLRAAASRSARAERVRAEAAGTPYTGQAGHVPDTTWTGNPDPPEWMDLTARVNTSLGGQAAHYPVGYRPTSFEFRDGP